MKIVKLLTITLLAAGLTGCFGKGEVRLKCDKPRAYQTAVPSKRVAAPEGLDQLDGLKEMPVPEARTPEQPANGDCIDAPPPIRTQ